jgi:hypothetical protein
VKHRTQVSRRLCRSCAWKQLFGRKGGPLSFKTRKSDRQSDGATAPGFEHASGYTDLERVLGEHTLNAEREAQTTAPKGYRARSIAKPAPSR